MKTLFSAAFLLLFVTCGWAQQLAFPTAEGFGRFAMGGRQGFVCYVTSTGTGTTGSLFDGGPHHQGTFRYCIGLSGARNILFSASGVIDLVSQVNILNSNLTIAGQTSPNKGILIKGMWLSVKGDHTIIRHFRSRPGYDSAMIVNGGSGWTALDFDNAAHAIVDHSSFSWATDDTINSFNSVDVTWQWVISTEGLGQPNYGRSLTSNGSSVSTRTSILNSYFAHNQDRSPQLTAAGDLQIVNVVNYNISSVGGRIWPRYGAQDVELVKNYFKPGPSGTSSIRTAIQSCGLGFTEVTSTAASNTRIYVDGNIHTVHRPTDTGDENTFIFTPNDPLPYVTNRLTSVFPAIDSEIEASPAKDRVLLYAGATVPQRDATDARVLADFTQGEGVVNQLTPTGFGGYDTYASGSRDLDTYDVDRDGIPNEWETACSSSINAATTNGGLSNSDRNDGAELVTTTGYSKLEHYLNELAGDYPIGSCGGLLAGGDTTGPTGVAIIAPTESQVVSGTSQNYEVTAIDTESTITGVDFYQNNSLIGSDVGVPDCGSNYCIAWNTTLLAEGDKTLYAIATSAGGSTQSATVNVTVSNLPVYTAVHTASAPTINGNLSEFSNANLIEFNEASDNTTDCKMMYDSTNLYIGCITTDNELTAAVTTSDNSSIFSDDSLEIVIDPDNSNGAWTSSDYKLVVNAQNAIYDVHTQSDTSWSYGGSTAVAMVGTLNDGPGDTSWTVEARIPWSSIGVTPSTSATYAINLQINDDDGTALVTRYRWNGASSNNLSEAMDIVLGEPVSGGDTTVPTVAITDPLNGATIGGTYTLRADAQDDSGILDVQFYRDTSTAICSADTLSPFECAIDTTALSETTHTFHAVARDTVSPTPNEATSATITVTVDNTAPAAPTGFTVTASYSDVGYDMILDWGDVTGAISYEIERCSGQSCSNFAIISTESISDYLDENINRKTEYCYRIRALDIASNPSSYSSTVCELSLDVIILDEPTALTTTHSTTISVLGPPQSLSTTHSSGIASLGPPSTLSTNHSTSPVFLGNPSALGTP